MKYLIDTHIWVWLEADPAKIAKRVVARLKDPRNEIWFSPLTVFEILELQRKGRLEMIGLSEDWILRSRSQHHLFEAPLTMEVAMETRNFLMPHHDPVDKMLVATARIFRLTLVTADRNIIESKAVATLAAR